MKGTDPVWNGLSKLAAVRTDGERSLKAARTGTLIDTDRLGDALVPRRQDIENELVEVEHFAKARDRKDGAALLLVRQSLDAMADVR